MNNRMETLMNQILKFTHIKRIPNTKDWDRRKDD